MYLLYIDESGVPELHAGTSHMVLLGLAVPAETWSDKSTAVAAIKSKYELKNKEIHTAWLARRYLEQESIPDFLNLDYVARRRLVTNERDRILRLASVSKSKKDLAAIQKNFRRTQDYIHLTRSERYGILTELAELVGSWEDCRLFADAILKAKYKYHHSPFQEAFEQVITRFQSFLDNYSRYKQTNFLGIIIQDNNPTEESRLTELMKKFHADGTKWKSITRIVETPLFVNSQLTEMVQLSDLCCYATRRFIENNETALFDIIYSRFDRKGTEVVGLRHFTGKQTCSCRICLDHGR